MAYVPLDATKPAGSQAGSAFATSANANDVALRDAIVTGQVAGYLYAQSGGTDEEPAVQTWTNGAIILRATNTWASGYGTQVVWALSVDSGSNYDTIATEARTFDGSGNLTATTGSGGISSWLAQWVGKFKSLRTLYTAHAAATGENVHGLGTLSTQDATAIAVTGGAIDGAAIGAVTPSGAQFKAAREQYIAHAPGSGAGVTLDWTYGGATVTNSGTNALTFSNVPSGPIATFLLYVSNLNSSTFPGAVTWGLGGKPSIAGGALVQMVTMDGGTTVRAVVAWRAV